jgi:protein-S-isoprenylcysteine O-methyltransferase Ste14
MTLPGPETLVLTLLLVSPFQWFAVGAMKTFEVPALRDSGAGWGGASFMSGSAMVLWAGLFMRLRSSYAIAGVVVSAASVVLYEWTRRTILGRRFFIALAGKVPAELCESGPYRYARHPFYLSYILAFTGMLVAIGTPSAALVFAANVILFVWMARDDERTIATSPLSSQYAEYRQRVGILLLLPWRR